jgi:hypothetical protein
MADGITMDSKGNVIFVAVCGKNETEIQAVVCQHSGVLIRKEE